MLTDRKKYLFVFSNTTGLNHLKEIRFKLKINFIYLFIYLFIHLYIYLWFLITLSVSKTIQRQILRVTEPLVRKYVKGSVNDLICGITLTFTWRHTENQRKSSVRIISTPPEVWIYHFRTQKSEVLQPEISWTDSTIEEQRNIQCNRSIT